MQNHNGRHSLLRFPFRQTLLKFATSIISHSTPRTLTVNPHFKKLRYGKYLLETTDQDVVYDGKPFT
jgi:hypothetical protein